MHGAILVRVRDATLCLFFQRQVLLMERMYMRREMYLSIMMDRGSQVSLV